MTAKILVSIDEYLFHFVCASFQTETAVQTDQFRLIKIHRTSVVGNFIVSFLKAHNQSVEFEKGYFTIAIRISKQPISDDLRKQFICLNSQLNQILNDFLRILFQNSFIFYVNGYRKDEKGEMRNAIREWIDRYELYEHDFTFCQLEQIYLRARRRKPLTNFVLKRK